MQAYRKAVIAILASEYVAFGMPELLDILDTIVRVAWCYVLARGVMSELFGIKGQGPTGVMPSVVDVFVRFNGVHLWWAIKSLF